MSFATANGTFNSPLLSSRLLCELAAVRSTLRTVAECSGPAVIVHAGGELDASNEITWGRLLSEASAAASPPGPFVIDTSGLDFMGCCAFAVLADVAQLCRRRGVDVRLVSSQPVVARIVDAGGLNELLSVHDSVEAALSASLD